MSARRLWSPSELNELWQRWRTGESIADIARGLERPPSTVHNYVELCGGVRPRPRRRSPRHLTLEDRETISRELAAGASLRAIASRLGRPASTISREVKRNGGRDAYRATRADSRAWSEATRFKLSKFGESPRLADLVAAKLRLQWSPEQISGWLRRKYPDDPTMTVSHETIYRSLFVQARGELKRELTGHLRRARFMRRSRLAKDYGHRGRGAIVNGVSIAERPPEVEDRAVPGHWEGDLLIGDQQSCIATLVERTTRFAMLVKVPARDSATVTAALARQIRRLPAELRKSLTWDRGVELAKHEELRVAADLQIYFCDPHSPWQRGSNENTNGLLRQYFPKGEPLGSFTQAELNAVARRLNERPRKTLDFQTPAESFSSLLQ